MFWSLVITFAMLASSGTYDYVYRWTDANGSVRVTNNLSSVPENKRGDAQPMRVFTIESVDETNAVGQVELVQNSNTVLFSETASGIVTSSLINGAARRDAIVDTGSEIAVITTKLAKALGYDIKTAREGRFRTPGGFVNAPVVELESIKIGSAKVKNVPAAVIDFKERGPVSAIIGMNFLSRFIFEIDYASKKITFQPPQ